MNTQPIALILFLALAVIWLFIMWSALVISSREEEEQQRWLDTMSAVGRQEWPATSTYPADQTEHDND